jgi:hypothetical protein
MVIPDGYMSLRGAVEYVTRWRARDAVATLTPEGFKFFAALKAETRPRPVPSVPLPLAQLRAGGVRIVEAAAAPAHPPPHPNVPDPSLDEATKARIRGWLEAKRALDAAREATRVDLRQALISGKLIAVALLPSGELVAMRAADWRARFLRVENESDERTWGDALLARADLARWCGAPPEPEPAERPGDWPAPPPERMRAEPLPASPPEPALISSGAPGRPSSMHLIRAEHQRRLDEGEAHESLAAEAGHLATWLAQQHPTAPQPTPKAIANGIRAAHRQRATRPPKYPPEITPRN